MKRCEFIVRFWLGLTGSILGSILPGRRDYCADEVTLSRKGAKSGTHVSQASFNRNEGQRAR